MRKNAVILNLFQDPVVNKIKDFVWTLKQVQGDGNKVRPSVQGDNRNKGFTLIELLVVVLIIGILAAVALPQYQVAVEKSRLARSIPLVRSIKNNVEVYRMANGSYPPNNSEALADVDVPAGCRDYGAGQLVCDTGYFDVQLGYGNASQAVMGTSRGSRTGNLNGYVMFFDYSSFAPGAQECWAAASNNTANGVCKSMGGVLNRSFSEPEYAGGQVNAYRLP